MAYAVTLLLSYSILPPFVAGIWRYRYIKGMYWPMLICLGLGVLNEVFSSIIIHAGGSNAFNCNIYYLLEALLLLTQFRKWGLFLSPASYYYTIICCSMAWIIEALLTPVTSEFFPYFRMMTAIGVIVLSLLHVFRLMSRSSHLISKDPGFIFCFGFCVYFLCVLITEIFIYEGSAYSAPFKDLLFRTSVFCNVISNCIYLIAILWTRMKPTFTTKLY